MWNRLLRISWERCRFRKEGGKEDGRKEEGGKEDGRGEDGGLNFSGRVLNHW
jgi:hypothetical protein